MNYDYDAFRAAQTLRDVQANAEDAWSLPPALRPGGYERIVANVEGEVVPLHFIHVIDVFDDEDVEPSEENPLAHIVIELAAVSQVDQRTAHGRLKVGQLIDEAEWIWTEA